MLRGPQGTLFGKNTTAGAINVTTRKPAFTPAAEAELNFGDLDYAQAKASMTGPAVREPGGSPVVLRHASVTGTLLNVATGERVNDMNNLGLARAVAVRAVGPLRRHLRRRPHPAACRGRDAGRCRRGADAAAGQPSVGRHHRRPELHPAELQRVRSADRRRFTRPLVPGSGWRVVERRLDRSGGRPPHLHDRVALVELGPVERPRFHRAAGDHRFGRHVEAVAVDTGTALRRRADAARELRRRGLLLSARGSTRTR